MDRVAHRHPRAAHAPPRARPPAIWPSMRRRARLKPPASRPARSTLIVLGTTTPDLIFPSTACLLQHRLGANGCAAFDVNAACSGFMYALGVADQFIRGGQAKKALVVGCRNAVAHDRLDAIARPACCSATAPARSCSKPSSEPGILVTKQHADGGYKHLLYNPVGVSAGFSRRAQPRRARDDGRQRSVQGRGQDARSYRRRNARSGRHARIRRRLADSASSQPAHHRGDRETTEACRWIA